jgi:hypothetical protein
LNSNSFYDVTKDNSLATYKSQGSEREADTAITRIIKGGFSGIILGYIIALLLSQWLWLEMRLNIGAIVPGSAVLFVLLALWKKFTIPYSLLLLFEAILLVTFLSIYGFQLGALLTVPACLLREGCNITSVDSHQINMVLGAALLLGNFAWIFSQYKKRRGTLKASL